MISGEIEVNSFAQIQTTWWCTVNLHQISSAVIRELSLLLPFGLETPAKNEINCCDELDLLLEWYYRTTSKEYSLRIFYELQTIHDLKTNHEK